jgi:hypothetical protein
MLEEAIARGIITDMRAGELEVQTALVDSSWASSCI